MNLLEQIQSDLKEALKARDELRANALRMAMSAIHNAKIAKGGEMTDADIVDVLRKEAKKRKESVEAYQNAGRTELAEKEQAEVELLEGYLPAQMGEDQIREIVMRIKGGGATDFGAVMKETMQATGGQADGQVVARIVKEILAD